MREIISCIGEPPYSECRDLPEAGVDAGYAKWADEYDDPGNDMIALEQPVIDAACGTGLHAAHLRGADTNR